MHIAHWHMGSKWEVGYAVMIFTGLPQSNRRPRVRNFIYVSDNSTHVVEHCCRAPAVNIADVSYAKVLCATLAAPLRIHQLRYPFADLCYLQRA